MIVLHSSGLSAHAINEIGNKLPDALCYDRSDDAPDGIIAATFISFESDAQFQRIMDNAP